MISKCIIYVTLKVHAFKVYYYVIVYGAVKGGVKKFEGVNKIFKVPD